MKSIFNFCPNCKSEKITTQNGHKYLCLDCHFEYFHNVASAVMVILQHENEILFTIRNENPCLGLLDLPGGFVDYNESANQTVIRELKEELNLDLSNAEIAFFNSYPNQYLYKNVLYRTLDLAFVISIEKEKVQSFDKNEIQALVWLKKNQIEFNQLAFESTKRFVGDILKQS